MKRQCSWGVVVVGLSALVGGRAEAGFVLTANAAGSQASTVSGVTTETFDSFKPGNYTTLSTAIGTLSSPGMAVVPENQYGGAGGTGNYFAVGAQSGQDVAVLNLKNPQAYFGIWWSAVDPLNEIAFLSAGQVVGYFDPAAAVGTLGSKYNGNPNGSGDSGEAFAYLNFIGTNGTTFDQVAFANVNTSTGFESDNWSVRSTPLGSPYPGTVIGTYGAVPEPSSLVLTASGVLALAGFARRRRRA